MAELIDLLGDPNIIRYITNFPFFIRNKKILIIGAGGGGDCCGCLPIYYWIKKCGGIPILGSLTWERTDVLLAYGPRPFSEIEKFTEIMGTVAWGSGATCIKNDGTRFQASRLAEVLDESVVYIDITQGTVPVITDLTQFCSQNNIYMIVPVDVGGDIISRATEPGLRSPIADGMTLSIIAQMEIPKVLGIFALNCDGELTLEELQTYLQEFNLTGWLYGQRKHSEEELLFMEKTIVESGAVTEASWQPVEYLHGKTGETTIRHGARKVQLEEIITHSFFLRLDEVYPSCPLANAVAQTNSIEEANSIILDTFHIDTEYEFERRDVEEKINAAKDT